MEIKGWWAPLPMLNVTRLQFFPYNWLLCSVCSSPGASVVCLQAHLGSQGGRLCEYTGPLHWAALDCFVVQILYLVIRTEMLVAPLGTLLRASSQLHYYLCRFIPQHYNYKEKLGTIRILHWWFGYFFLSVFNCCHQGGIRQHSAIWHVKRDVRYRGPVLLLKV